MVLVLRSFPYDLYQVRRTSKPKTRPEHFFAGFEETRVMVDADVISLSS